MDDQEREKLFQEIRARIGDADMEERRLREEELAEEAMRQKKWHWSVRVLFVVGIFVLSFAVYLILAKMGLIW